jgi:hypothetical protein
VDDATLKATRRRILSQKRIAINALIDDPGLDAEMKATDWLRKKGFTRIKAHTRPNDPYDKVAWKSGRKWIIEVKGGLRKWKAEGSPQVSIKNLVSMAQKKGVQEVGLLFMPKREPPLLFRLEGGGQRYRWQCGAVKAWQKRQTT